MSGHAAGICLRAADRRSPRHRNPNGRHGGRKKKAAAAPRTPEPLLWVEIDRPEQPEPEQPEPVPAGPITDDDIPF